MISWYRQLLRAPDFLLSAWDGVPLSAGRGDYVRSDLLTGEPSGVRSLFGPPIKGSRIPDDAYQDSEEVPVIRLPHQIGRRRKDAVLDYLVDVVSVVEGQGDLDAAVKSATRSAAVASVPCRPVVAVAPGIDIGGCSVDVFRSSQTMAFGIARSFFDSACRAVAFVESEEDYGWIEDRYRRLDWTGSGSLLPEVGFSRLIFDPRKTGEVPTLAPPVCVVVTAHNRPEVLVPCVRSILDRTQYPNFSVLIADDCCDDFTQSQISALSEDPRVSVIRSSKNLGYLENANRSFEAAIEPGQVMAAGASMVVLVNSDVLVTDGWLSGMVRCSLLTGASLVNPLCNNSAMISIPFAGQSPAYLPRMRGGRGYLDAAASMRVINPAYPDAVPSVGQCLLITRDAWKDHGPFDGLTYGTGYGEECALWAKVLDGGGNAKVADDVFVYHESHATHGDAAKAAEKHGVETFIKNHGETYRINLHKMWDWPKTVGLHRSAVAQSRPRSLPLSFVTFDIGPWGGVFCILKLVSELAELGISTSVAHLTEHENQFVMPYGPMMFGTRGEMAEWSGGMGWDTGIVVATHWYSALLAREIAEKNEGIHTLAFWQDREDFFKGPKGNRALDDKSISSYVAIEDRIVNASWVGESARAELGISGFTHIPVGVDTLMFYPRPRLDGERPIRILGMWRPSTKRRGHARLKETYLSIKAKWGDLVSLELYGQKESLPKCDVHHGWLSQRGVADLVGAVDIFLEPSDFQGFGLPGLEAMASGVALVSTDNRGIHEYGVHEKNCFIAEDDESFVGHIENLIRSPDLRASMGKTARETSLAFDWKVIAAKWVQEIYRIVMREDGLVQFRSSIDRSMSAALAVLNGRTEDRGDL